MGLVSSILVHNSTILKTCLFTLVSFKTHSPSISLLPKLTRFGQPMDTFRRLGAPTHISLNDGLSFNNNNKEKKYKKKICIIEIESHSLLVQGPTTSMKILISAVTFLFYFKKNIFQVEEVSEEIEVRCGGEEREEGSIEEGSDDESEYEASHFNNGRGLFPPTPPHLMI